MVQSLLRTKLVVPALRAQRVSRPQLDIKVHRALDVPLTLVSAPPGFGKTTTLLSALQELQSRAEIVVGWVSLDERDNEPTQFWGYMAAALPIANADELSDIQPFPIEDWLNAILAHPGQVLLVLDDYHVITERVIHDGLAYITEHAPQNLHLVIITRADPALPLHRLRARGKLVELRAADLRFGADETADFLNEVMGLGLSAGNITRLVERTEGWAAGLQLAGLAIQGEAGTNDVSQAPLIDRIATSDRYIIDYLAEEVLNQQPEAVQAFLLQTAILGWMCGPLCDAVTQREGSQDILFTLVQRNLFVVPAGASGGFSWFRYHRLFADLLRGQLQQHFSDSVPALHQRAAEWYEAHGDIPSAIEHALDGKNYAHVERLLDHHALPLVMSGNLLMVERWMGRLPQGWQRLPRVNLAFAWALIMRGRYAEVEPYLDRAEAVIAEATALQGELFALRAGLASAQGQAQAALDYGQRALSSLQAENTFVQALVVMALAGAHRLRGDLDAAIATYERAIPLCEAAGLTFPAMVSRAQLASMLIIKGHLRQAETVARPILTHPTRHPTASAVLGALAEIAIEWNQLDDAETYLQQALSQDSGHNAALARCQVLMAQLRRIQGDMAAAQAMLDMAAARIQQGVPAWVTITHVAERAMLWIRQGMIGAAEHLLRETAGAPNHAAGPVREALPLAWGWLRFAQERYAEARTILAEVLTAAESDGRQRRVIEILVLRALVEAADGESRTAQTTLKQALALAEPEQYVRTFVDAGPPMAALLAQTNSPYAQRLLAAFPEGQRSTPDGAEALTDRELEVVRLMAQGLTYQQIADDLVVSINTVRHHVKGIYSKLGVETRTLALEKARLLNLL